MEIENLARNVGGCSEKRAGAVLRFIRWVLGWCPSHGWLKYPRRFRMNTDYEEIEKNYSVGCRRCQIESYEHWQELRDDYYRSYF